MPLGNLLLFLHRSGTSLQFQALANAKHAQTPLTARRHDMLHFPLSTVLSRSLSWLLFLQDNDTLGLCLWLTHFATGLLLIATHSIHFCFGATDKHVVENLFAPLLDRGSKLNIFWSRGHAAQVRLYLPWCTKQGFSLQPKEHPSKSYCAERHQLPRNPPTINSLNKNETYEISRKFSHLLNPYDLVPMSGFQLENNQTRFF